MLYDTHRYSCVRTCSSNRWSPLGSVHVEKVLCSQSALWISGGGKLHRSTLSVQTEKFVHFIFDEPIIALPSCFRPQCIQNNIL